MWSKRLLGLLIAGAVVSLGFFVARPVLAAPRKVPSAAPLGLLTAGAMAHPGPGGRWCGQAGLQAAAKALGMTVDELTTQLWAGRTLADLADQKGVDLQSVRDAVLQACEQALRDAIEQAVQNGRISREMADWLLEGLNKGFWGPRATNGFWGFGRGWHRGWWDKGWWRAPQPTPTPSPGSSS
ncbi:hypothetical protein [Thermoflexus sp.]|uniref:hypothetical protein n=1 Tax=Thermoflexus sp. TaxID=1969742 RepID=UPI0035E3FE84